MAGVGLTELEQLILAALTILEKGRSCAAIQEQAETFTCGIRTLSSGTLYSALDRLEVKGYVRGMVFGLADDRDGRSKRQYEITRTGHMALRNSLRITTRMIAELKYYGWRESYRRKVLGNNRRFVASWHSMPLPFIETGRFPGVADSLANGGLQIRSVVGPFSVRSKWHVHQAHREAVPVCAM